MAHSFRGNLKRSHSIAYASIPFLLILVTWAVLSYGGFVAPLFLPTPSAVVIQTVTLIRNDGLIGDVGVSLSRIFAGFALSVLLAVPIGILAGSFRSADAVVTPLMAFIRYMPATAFIPVVILWFGIGFWEKVIVVFISIFFYLVLLVADAAASVRKEFIETALTLGATRAQVVVKVIVPACLPEVWNALRVMLGVGWTMIVVVEMVAAQNGVGAMIISAQRFLQTPKVIAGIVVIGVLGIITDAIFRAAYKLFFRWVER
jgi:NitT/TauT family transport system permease protein